MVLDFTVSYSIQKRDYLKFVLYSWQKIEHKHLISMFFNQIKC
jgi:hypothetical protein